MGINLCFLYALNAVDFHAGNIITSKYGPALIDFEGLLNVYEEESVKPTHAVDITDSKISHSVLGTGVLPFLLGPEGADVSGISNYSQQKTFIKVPKIINAKTSFISVIRDYKSTDGEQNHPTLNGKSVNEKKFINHLLKGFQDAYSFFTRQRVVILNTIQEFCSVHDVFTREIPKPTMFYANLLDISNHPLFLTSELDQRMFFTRVLEKKEKDSISDFEYTALLRGDVPYFLHQVEKRDLYVGVSSQKIPNYYKSSSIDVVKSHISKMSQEDMDFQSGLIKSSLGIRDGHSRISTSQYPSVTSKYQDNIQTILSAIIDKSDRCNGEISWYSCNAKEKMGPITLSTMGNALYDGLMGMALLYLFANKFFDDDQYYKVAASILKSINRNGENDSNNIGAFTGTYSLIYGNFIFYEMTQNKYFWNNAISLIEKSKNQLMRVQSYDIIYGLSGILLILVNAYQKFRINHLVPLIELIVRRLLNEKIQTSNNEVYWRTANGPILTGFAHGNAGIIYALSRYLNVFKYSNSKDEIINVIKKALKFEHLRFHNNHYYDSRITEKGTIPYAWCHGIPGIELSSLELLNLGLMNKSKIISSTNDILKNGFGKNTCLCHGDIGNLIILQQISNTIDASNNIVKEVLQKIRNIDISNISIFTSGFKTDFLVPELMTGVGGIAYGLMYLNSDNLPNILKLEI